MYYWEDDIYIVIPLSYNIFFRESLKNKRRISFAREFSISDGLFDELKDLIIEKGSEKTIVVDMEQVNYPGKMFEDLYDIKKKVIFYNIQSDLVRKKMQENLPILNWNQEESICYLNGIISDDVVKAYESIFKSVSKELYSGILRDIVDFGEVENPLLLDSSGLYSNMYISVKKLFLNPQSYYFVLFGMAAAVESLGEFDSFISSSKNGAILANLLGAMLNKKVVHIQGVGPKYSMRFGNKQNEIKKGKTYVYVFDFKCTGTESKILSALVNANDAYLAGEIGFAQYYCNDSDRLRLDDRVKCLITTGEAGLQYKVAGSKSDIIKLMQC